MQTPRPGTLIAAALLGASSIAGALHAQTAGIALVDAVRSTLATHPALLVEQAQVDISQGQQARARAAFDTLNVADLSLSRADTPLRLVDRTSLASAGLFDIDGQRTNLATLGVGATKLLRSGVAVNLSSTVTRTADNITYGTGVSRSVTRVGVTLPMAGGRGRDVVASEEIATRGETRATTLDVQQIAAQLIANTTASYWSLAAAKKQLDIARDSEVRGRRLSENVQTLIDADRSPRDDLNNVAANLASRIGKRIAVEQTVFERRRTLALDMGLNPQSPDALPDTADLLPDPETTAPPDLDDATVNCYVAAAMRDRADMRAAAARLQAARARVTGAKDLLRPRVDATVSLGYAGMHEGLRFDDYFAGLSGAHGLDVQFGFSYKTRSPQIAAAETLEAQALVTQAELRERDLERSVRSSVFVALSAVRNSVTRLQSMSASVNLFRQALDGQQEKLRLGVASVVELLTVEDRLTTALFDLTDAQVAYPVAVIQLALVTGAITTAEHPTAVADGDVFFRVRACQATGR